MSEVIENQAEIPRGIDQLRLSEEAGLEEIRRIISDEDTFVYVAKAVHSGYERKWQRTRPIQPKPRNGGPFTK